MRARQMVQERLAQASFLPPVSKAPVMLQPISSTSRAIVIGMSSETVSLIDIGVLARWNVKPRLIGLPEWPPCRSGGAGPATAGAGGYRRLRAAGVSLDQVIETTGSALSVSPLTFLEASTPGAGGSSTAPTSGSASGTFPRSGHRKTSPTWPWKAARAGPSRPARRRRLPADQPAAGPPPGTVVNASTGALTTPADRLCGRTARRPTARRRRHRGRGPPALIGDTVVNDGKGLLLVVEKLPWADTTDVTREVESALAALQPGLQGVEFDPTIFRPAGFIDRAVDDLAVTALVAPGTDRPRPRRPVLRLAHGPRRPGDDPLVTADGRARPPPAGHDLQRLHLRRSRGRHRRGRR